MSVCLSLSRDNTQQWVCQRIHTLRGCCCEILYKWISFVCSLKKIAQDFDYQVNVFSLYALHVSHCRVIAHTHTHTPVLSEGILEKSRKKKVSQFAKFLLSLLTKVHALKCLRYAQ